MFKKGDLDGKYYFHHIEEKEVYVALYNPKNKIKCLSKTYYGSHNKNSNYHYAYKIEHIIIK